MCQTLSNAYCPFTLHQNPSLVQEFVDGDFVPYATTNMDIYRLLSTSQNVGG